MKQFITAERLERISNVVKSRQHSLFVVLENIHDPHNVSAIYRTCDAAGVPAVGLLYTKEKFPSIQKVSSASAKKWVDTSKYTSVDECFSVLKKEGFRIVSTVTDEAAENIYNIDLTEKTAIVLGNEHRGVSDEAAEKSDKKLFIPMSGMIKSLNVSVAAAVILFEAARQRYLKGMYKNSELNEAEIEKIIEIWADR